MTTDTKETRIRRMAEADVDGIVALDGRISGKDRAPSWPQKAASHLKTCYRPLCFVAEDEDRIVGFILGDIRGSEYSLPLSGWLDIMGVDIEYQKMGIGQRLVNAFVDECRRIGVKARTIIRDDDEQVRRFLGLIGFQQGRLIDYER